MVAEGTNGSSTKVATGSLFAEVATGSLLFPCSSFPYTYHEFHEFHFISPHFTNLF